jgi:hypothetical protein
LNLEYVLSGLDYIMNSRQIRKFESAKSMYYDFFGHKMNDIMIAGLFNAYREGRIGNVMDEIGVDRIYSDSGGLQMALYGLDIDEEIRKSIYEVQATRSMFAFCFDDIPLKASYELSGSSARTEIDSKYFDTSILKDKALKTASNLKEQIHYFQERGSTTKVWAIIQGNCIDTLCQWADIMFSQFNDDELKSIHGIALADTCIGNDISESLEMLQSYGKMNLPDNIKKNLHFLGIGSLSRLIPIIELSNTKVLSDVNISFDSTSHSSSLALGKYVDENNRMIRLGNYRTPQTEEIMNLVIRKWMPDQYETDLADEMMNILMYPLGKVDYEEIGSEKFEFLIRFRVGYCKETVDKFTSFIKNVYNDNSAYDKYISKSKYLDTLKTLRHVDSFKDYDKWIKDYLKYMPSKRIKSQKSSSLEEFFIA